MRYRHRSLSQIVVARVPAIPAAVEPSGNIWVGVLGLQPLGVGITKRIRESVIAMVVAPSYPHPVLEFLADRCLPEGNSPVETYGGN